MDVVFWLDGVEFEWDGNKARSNAEKPGVTFEEAAEAFFDPFASLGDASVGGESRSYIIGYNFGQQLLTTICLERGVRTRIIVETLYRSRPAPGFITDVRRTSAGKDGAGAQ